MNVRYRVELAKPSAKTHQAAERWQTGDAQAEAGSNPFGRRCGASDEEIAISVDERFEIYRTKRRFVEGNLEAALSEEPRPGACRKLSGKEEALLVATACSKPPEGRAGWTLELLAARWSNSPSM